MDTAVFLLNLGGPRDLDEVEPYLFELFSDPGILAAPLGPFRRPLARYIARLRSPSSREKYRLIGGGSPLVTETQAQARALAPLLGAGHRLYLAMRYGHPNTEEAVREALADGAGSALSLPLYPQYAEVSTGSALREVRRLWPRSKPLYEVVSYGDHPGWLDAVAATLVEALRKVKPENRERTLVIFSAHGLPLRQVRKDDRYPREVEASARGAALRAGVAKWQVTYQSRVGPVKWLGPDTVEFIRAHAKGRVVIAVPISFVSEHLETLYDLDVMAARAAKEGGALEFHRAAAVGARPEFMAALAEQVRQTLAMGRRVA